MFRAAFAKEDKMASHMSVDKFDQKTTHMSVDNLFTINKIVNPTATYIGNLTPDYGEFKFDLENKMQSTPIITQYRIESFHT